MTAKLILALDGAVKKEYPALGDSISVGRKHGNDIQVNDMTVSGRHALFTRLLGQTYVEDLGSTNGTLVNGRLVRKCLIKHGDNVQMGQHQFTYFDDDQAGFEPTMFLKAEMDHTQVIDPETPVPELGKGTPLAGVKLQNGPLHGKVLELRKPFNTLGYKGIKLAMITRSNVGYVIIGLKSRQSRRASDVPLVNGKALRQDAVHLDENDLIEVAGFQMKFILLR